MENGGFGEVRTEALILYRPKNKFDEQDYSFLYDGPKSNLQSI